MAYDDFTAKMVRRVHELENALAEKDREIAYLQDARQAAASMDAQRAAEYHALMEQAVKMAEVLVSFTFSNTPNGRIPRDFLASPEVREWREKEKGNEISCT